VRINEIVRGWRNYFALPDEKAIAEQLHHLDGQIEQMANYYLSVNVKDDPAWLTRERFLLPGMDCSLENEQEAAHREAETGCGYPEHSTNDGNVRSLIKEDAAESEESKKHPTIVIDDAGEKEENEEDISNFSRYPPECYFNTPRQQGLLYRPNYPSKPAIKAPATVSTMR